MQIRLSEKVSHEGVFITVVLAEHPKEVPGLVKFSKLYPPEWIKTNPIIDKHLDGILTMVTAYLASRHATIHCMYNIDYSRIQIKPKYKK